MGIIDAECPGTKARARIQKSLETFSNLMTFQPWLSNSFKILLGNRIQCRLFKRLTEVWVGSKEPTGWLQHPGEEQ